MSQNENNNNSLVYLLAGFGLGALLGALAGILFAPKPGDDTREELQGRLKDMKGRTEDWIAEQRTKRLGSKEAAAEEVGA